MLTRKAFITNSSSTAYVAFGILYDERDEEAWRIVEEIGKIEKIYKQAYKQYHPDAIWHFTSQGELHEAVKVPLGFHSEYEFGEPYFMASYIGAGGGSENYTPEPFDPKEIPEAVMIEALREFCELTGIPFKEPKWYVVGTSM